MENNGYDISVYEAGVDAIRKDIIIVDAEIDRIERNMLDNDTGIALALREQNKRLHENALKKAHGVLRELNVNLKKALLEIEVIKVVGTIPKTPTEFVYSYIKHIKAEITLNNCITKCSDKLLGAVDALGDMLHIVNDNMKLGFRENIINYAFDQYLRENSFIRKSALVDLVGFDGNIRVQEWIALAVACFTGDPPEYTVAVLRKFIWQVKRKMVGLDIYNHIMPVIYGSQGTGKTVFLGQFVGPIAENVTYPNLKEITDTRHRQLWSRWVLVVDEMEGYDKTDVDALKNVITKQYVSGRVMHSQKDFNDINSASLIGASNRTLDELVKDSTGMRRFIQLYWGDVDDAGWAVVNKTDFLGLWKSVDLNEPDPMEPFREYTKARQEELRQKTYVEQWLIDEERDYGFDCEKRWIGWKGSALLHIENFSVWLRSRFNVSAFTFNRFGKEMKRLEGKLIECRRSSAGIQYRLIDQPQPDTEHERDVDASSSAFMPKGVNSRLRTIMGKTEKSS